MKFQTTDRFNISEEVLLQEVNGETVLLDLEGESYSWQKSTMWAGINLKVMLVNCWVSWLTPG